MYKHAIRTSGRVAVNGQANSAISKDRLRLWLKLLKTSRFVEAQLRQRLREDFHTTLPRFDVLAALAREPGGMRMSELSDALRVSNGNVTGIVERLVLDGLVRRLPVSGDRRATAVALTQSGAILFREIAEAHEGWIDEIFGAIGRDQLAAAMALFEGIVATGESNGDASE
jgi:DNA-binding MarR family transcriptional regulator